MAREGRFVEWAEVHGHLYGTSKAELLRRRRRGDLVLDIDVQGARQVRRKIPEAVQVFIMPPKYEELRRRLRRRKQDSAEDVERRLRDAAAEVRAFAGFDYVVVNGDLGRAAAELESVILASRCRPGARAAALRPILRSFAAQPRNAARKGKP
jgi:guanylate kinase